MKLDAQWITGFVDGEGCFHVGINPHRETTTGYQVLPENLPLYNTNVSSANSLCWLKDYRLTVGL